MSVTIGRAIRDGLRSHGVIVHESPGPGVYVARPGSWEARGNGLISRYKGLVVHHTAGNFGRDYSTLYNGRSDLPGPLCNTSGNEDGSVTMIAAHPANHAGASGGWDTAPLPRTSLFNPEVWGHEICYPGTVPMRAAQWRTAAILGRVVCDVLSRLEDYIKFHQGTSITGKYDAGYAPGKTYDIAALRRDAVSIQAGGGADLDANQAQQLKWVYDRLVGMTGVDHPHYVVDESGKARQAAPSEPGAQPVKLLTTLDGNYLLNAINSAAKPVPPT